MIDEDPQDICEIKKAESFQFGANSQILELFLANFSGNPHNIFHITYMGIFFQITYNMGIFFQISYMDFLDEKFCEKNSRISADQSGAEENYKSGLFKFALFVLKYRG